MPSITITGRIPSKKNSTVTMARGDRVLHFPSNKYQAWNEDALWQLKGKEKIPNGTHLILQFYMPDNRRCDLTNKSESIMDTLVDAGILEDDSWQVIPVLELQFIEVDKINPRCVIVW